MRYILNLFRKSGPDIKLLRESIKKSLADDAKANIRKGWVYEGRRLG